MHLLFLTADSTGGASNRCLDVMVLVLFFVPLAFLFPEGSLKRLNIRTEVWVMIKAAATHIRRDTRKL